MPVFGVLFFEATKSPFIDRNQGTRDQQKTTRRVGVGYSRKLTPSTLMMFILYTSFVRWEKKKQSQQHKKVQGFGIRHPGLDWRGLNHSSGQFLENPLINFQQDLPSNSNSITPGVAVSSKPTGCI